MQSSEKSIAVGKLHIRYMKNPIIQTIKYKQKLRSSSQQNTHVQPEISPPVNNNDESEARSKTHWVGYGSFEDKHKRRPPNVLVDLPGADWCCDDLDPNSYSGSRGSYLGNSKDDEAYLGQHSDVDM
jgi:hypothetical protein